MNQTDIYDELSIVLEGGVSTTQSFSNVYLPQRDVCEATQQAIKTPTCSLFILSYYFFCIAFPKPHSNLMVCLLSNLTVYKEQHVMVHRNVSFCILYSGARGWGVP